MNFSADGTLIEAWASLKIFKPRADQGDNDEQPPTGGGRNAEADFKGEKRSNEMHISTTDPDAKLYRKGSGQEAKLCITGHALMEKGNGIYVDARLTRVSGHAERLAALEMIEERAERPHPVTLAADRGFDAADFVAGLREMNVTPHIAQNTSRKSATDRRATRRPGYTISQRVGKRIEEGLGWMTSVAGMRETKFRGLKKVGWALTFCAAAYNIIRIPKLIGA